MATTIDAPVTVVEREAMAAEAVERRKIYRSGEAEVRALDGVTVGFNCGEFTRTSRCRGQRRSASACSCRSRTVQ